MKRIIKSIKVHRNSIVVTTKSHTTRQYFFTNQQDKMNYYFDLKREMNYDNQS